LYTLLQNCTKIFKSVFGQRIFNRLVCNYHVFTKSLISDLKKKEKNLTDTLNIRHGLKINILVNKYSENIFPFMKCYTDTEIYTDQTLTFNICKMIMEKIIISLKKNLKILIFVHIFFYTILSATNNTKY